MVNSPRARRLSYPLLAAMLAGGCGSPGGDAAPTTQPTSAASSATPAPTTTTPSPTATTPAAVSAADGRNYKACRDGVCEVAVSRPTTIRLGGGGKLKVRKVLPRGLDFDLTLAGGGGASGTLLFKGACGTITRVNISGGGSGDFCNADGSPLPPPEPQTGTVALQVPGRTAGGAIVLRIVSG